MVGLALLPLESSHLVPEPLILLSKAMVLFTELRILSFELAEPVQRCVKLRLKLRKPECLLGANPFKLRDADIFGVGEDLGIKIPRPRMSSSIRRFGHEFLRSYDPLI